MLDSAVILLNDVTNVYGFVLFTVSLFLALSSNYNGFVEETYKITDGF